MAKEDISAFLGPATCYEGHLTFTGAVRIDGRFTGEIRSEGTLILGKEARVQGKIAVNELVLSGHINGEIIVSGKTILHKNACLLGELSTKSLIMEEGAILQGTISMRPELTNTEGSSDNRYALAGEELPSEPRQ